MDMLPELLPDGKADYSKLQQGIVTQNAAQLPLRARSVDESPPHAVKFLSRKQLMQCGKSSGIAADRDTCQLTAKSECCSLPDL